MKFKLNFIILVVILTISNICFVYGANDKFLNYNVITLYEPEIKYIDNNNIFFKENIKSCIGDLIKDNFEEDFDISAFSTEILMEPYSKNIEKMILTWKIGDFDTKIGYVCFFDENECLYAISKSGNVDYSIKNVLEKNTLDIENIKKDAENFVMDLYLNENNIKIEDIKCSKYFNTDEGKGYYLFDIDISMEKGTIKRNHVIAYPIDVYVKYKNENLENTLFNKILNLIFSF